MSKITPKNLSYDSSLPPFLARLQANNASRDDRHEYTIARPKKARNLDEEAEDEPVYFNEETGESLRKSEWEAKEAEGEKFGAEEKADVIEEKEAKESKEKIVAIGASRKRKAGKVVGGDEGNGEVVKDRAKEEKDEEKTLKVAKGEAGKKVDKAKGGKPVKKVKKVKLSFGDDE